MGITCEQVERNRKNKNSINKNQGKNYIEKGIINPSEKDKIKKNDIKQIYIDILGLHNVIRNFYNFIIFNFKIILFNGNNL